jgi:type 2 lantibiotic biosynthesis protein LanM
MPTWEGSEACPRLRWRLRRYEYLDNLPKLSSLPQRIDAAGIEDIERGFRQAYGCINALAADLTRPAGALDHFRGCRTRVVLHDTAEYASILFFSLAPAHLASGRNYWVAMEALSGSLPQYDNLRAEAVLEEDRRCCLVQDIPAWYSTADSTTLEAPSGRSFPGIVQESALEQARIRIRSAGPDDCAFQAGVLRAALLASLVGRADAHAAPSQSPSDFTSLLGWGQLNAAAITPQRQDAAAERERAYDFARKIADTLLTHAIDLPRGKAWLGLTRAAGSISQIAPIVAFPWTCAGAAGTALLFANLHHATPDPRYEEMARAGLAHTVHTIDVVSRTTWWNTASLSAYTGIGFPIYALTEAGRLLNDTSLYERALEITRAIDPDRIRGEANPDWLAGASGFTAALLHLDGIVPDRALKTRAIAAVEAILRVAETTGGSGGILTPGFDRPLLGAAHGAAGIAAACALVYARTEHRGALRMAHHLLEWEREQFDRTAHDWPDLRREEGVPRFMSGWCAGPAGALLARLLAARAINWPDAEEELSQAIGNVAQRLGIDRHHVCCGEGGRILALKAAAVGLGRPELDRQCVHAAANMDRFLDSHGFLHHQEITDPAWTPGLLDGAAGMALAALASVHPGCSNPLSLDHFANRS